MGYIEYSIIIAIMVLIAIAIVKSKKKDFKVEINKLVEYLGGRENITSFEVAKSRFVVELQDVSKVNKEGIQKLGAKGIVEIENQLKIILGENARLLEKYIKELK